MLLRGSEAACLAATANGVGLPPFTFAEAIVELDRDEKPAVALSLRCGGGPDRTYPVRPVSGMETFSEA